MQLKHYCKDCGHPNIYVETKPKFCTECGFNFLSDSKANKTPLKPQKRPKVEQDIEEDDEEDEEDGEIETVDASHFKVEIKTVGSQGEKWEHVITQGAIGINRPKGNYTISDFKKEASNPIQPLELGGDDE